jgi:hypothetical protein
MDVAFQPCEVPQEDGLSSPPRWGRFFGVGQWAALTGITPVPRRRAAVANGPTARDGG